MRSRKKETARRKKRYRERRLRLLLHLLGDDRRCWLCGRRVSLRPRRAEFHHIVPRRWKMETTSRLQRIRNIEREAAEGKIRVVHSRCNKLLGSPDDPEGDAEFLREFCREERGSDIIPFADTVPF